MEHHELLIEARTDEEALLVCSRPECGRRLVVGKARMTVLSTGDFYALHTGGNPDLDLSVSIAGA